MTHRITSDSKTGRRMLSAKKQLVKPEDRGQLTEAQIDWNRQLEELRRMERSRRRRKA